MGLIEDYEELVMWRKLYEMVRSSDYHLRVYDDAANLMDGDTLLVDAPDIEQLYRKVFNAS